MEDRGRFAAFILAARVSRGGGRKASTGGWKYD
jgi:hypothetical protein